MDVDTAAVVVWDPETRSDAGGGNNGNSNNTTAAPPSSSGSRRNTTSANASNKQDDCGEHENKGDDVWAPCPTSENRAATHASVWVDPFWTGITCERIGPLVYDDSEDSDDDEAEEEMGWKRGRRMERQGHSAHRHRHPSSASYGRRAMPNPRKRNVAVFRIKGRITPTAPSTVDGILFPAAPASGSAGVVPLRSICNSVKIHFFHVFRDAQGEMHREFLYSSGFPLAALTGAPGRRGYGLFNYNATCDTGECLRGLKLFVLPLNRSMRPPLPADAIVYAIEGPSNKEHERTVCFTQWMGDVVKNLSPQIQSPFINMRTICRDWQNTGLFQDLHRLFETPGTCLPPTVGVYALYGALSCNGGISAQRLIKEVMEGLALRPSDATNRTLFMRIARDTIACFSLCAVEGIYWSDVCLGRAVEDQPFPLSFMPTERVFGKDDCEGRVSQMQQVVQLLRCMHRCSESIGLGGFTQRIREMRSYRELLSELPRDAFDGLVEGCCIMGNLFERGILDAQTIVGEARFACLQEAMRQDLVGHSFGVLFYRRKDVQDACILECTGWERTYIEGFDRPLTAVEGVVQKRLPEVLKQASITGLGGPPIASICGLMARALEERCYARLFFGHGCVFFDQRAGIDPYPQYSGLFKNARRNLIKWPRDAAGVGERDAVYSVETRDLILALCEDSEQPSDWAGKMQTRLWPPQQGARQMLDVYDQLQASIASKRRCLRPPPKDEADIEALMCARWAPLGGNDQHAWEQKKQERFGNRGFFFSIPRQPQHHRPHRHSHHHHHAHQAAASPDSMAVDEEESVRQAITILLGWKREPSFGGSDGSYDNDAKDERRRISIRSMPFMASRIFNVAIDTA